MFSARRRDAQLLELCEVASASLASWAEHCVDIQPDDELAAEGAQLATQAQELADWVRTQTGSHRVGRAAAWLRLLARRNQQLVAALSRPGITAPPHVSLLQTA